MAELGLYVGEIDGIPLGLTRKALLAYHDSLFPLYRWAFERICQTSRKRQSAEGTDTSDVVFHVPASADHPAADCVFADESADAGDTAPRLVSYRVEVAERHSYVFHFGPSGVIEQEGLMDTSKFDPDGSLVIQKRYIRDGERHEIIYRGVPYRTNGLLIEWQRVSNLSVAVLNGYTALGIPVTEAVG